MFEGTADSSLSSHLNTKLFSFFFTQKPRLRGRAPTVSEEKLLSARPWLHANKSPCSVYSSTRIHLSVQINNTRVPTIYRNVLFVMFFTALCTPAASRAQEKRRLHAAKSSSKLSVVYLSGTRARLRAAGPRHLPSSEALCLKHRSKVAGETRLEVKRRGAFTQRPPRV